DALAELTRLYRTSLVQYNTADTYRLHPLLAQFARRTPPAENFQLRFVNYYVSYVEAHYHDYDALASQLTNILRMIDIALAHNAIEALVDTLSMFFAFLENRGLLRRIDTQMKRLYEQVQRHDDTKQKAIVAYYYGRLERRLGHWQHGEALTREALTLSTANQQIRVMLLCHNSLGIHAQQAGQLADALAHFEQARTIINEHALFGYRYSNLINTATVHYKLEDYATAHDLAQQVLDHIDDIDSEPEYILITLGSAYALLRDIAHKENDTAQAHYYQGKGLALANIIDHADLQAEFKTHKAKGVVSHTRK
ncbi:MAG: hypothetical protein AAFN11_21195, partial [Chloroflexota bacterium]